MQTCVDAEDSKTQEVEQLLLRPPPWHNELHGNPWEHKELPLGFGGSLDKLNVCVPFRLGYLGILWFAWSLRMLGGCPSAGWLGSWPCMNRLTCIAGHSSGIAPSSARLNLRNGTGAFEVAGKTPGTALLLLGRGVITAQI